MPGTGERTDPFRTFNFQIDIDGVPGGGFSECAGLSMEVESVEYREGTDLQVTKRQLMGLQKPAVITLKRGYTQEYSLWKWYGNIRNGIPDRRNVTITLMNEEHQPVLRWHAENAWIKKIEGPSLKAGGMEVAYESVELAHEGLTLDI